MVRASLDVVGWLLGGNVCYHPIEIDEGLARKSTRKIEKLWKKGEQEKLQV